MRKILLSLALAASLLSARAQNKATIESVYSVTMRNSGSIISDGQIKGYYFFYQSDKVDRKTNEYGLRLLDGNLNTVKTITFQDSKDLVLLESSYNGGALMFSFYNDDEKLLTYRTYTMEGTKSFEYTRELDKKSNSYFKLVLSQQGGDEDASNNNLYDVAGRGFLAVLPTREERKYTYEVNFYASDKRRSWTFNPVETGKYQTAQYLGNNDSIAIFEILSKDKLLSGEMESTLLGIDMATGRKVFEAPTEHGTRQLYPMNMTRIEGSSNFLVIGPYYEGKTRVMQDNTKGLGVWVMDPKGKIVEARYNPYDGTMSKYAPVNNRGQFSSLGYLYFHNIIQTADGNFFAVGEGYKRVADGWGIAAKMLSRGSSNVSVTKLKITDMMLVQLNSKFELTNAQVYEKKSNDFSVPGGDFVSAHVLAMLARTMGAFDYRFTQMTKDRASFTTGYLDYEKTKDYKGLTFNSITYADGKVTRDKMNLATKATRMQVYPAKPGFIMIAEYFKKDKKLDIRLEKIS